MNFKRNRMCNLCNLLVLYFVTWSHCLPTSTDGSTTMTSVQTIEETLRDTNRKYTITAHVLIDCIIKVLRHTGWRSLTVVFDRKTDYFVTDLCDKLQESGILNYRLLKVPSIIEELPDRLLNFYLEEESHYKNYLVVCGTDNLLTLMSTVNSLDEKAKRRTYARHHSRWLLMTSHHVLNNLKYTASRLDHLAVLNVENEIFNSFERSLNSTESSSVSTTTGDTQFLMTSLVFAPEGRHWLKVGHVDSDRVYAQSDVFPNLRFGFNRRKFIVTTKEWPGFVIKSVIESKEIYTGFCIDLLNEIAKKLNFTYELIGPDDGQYGSLKNGKWTGIVGQLDRKEVDFTMAALSTNSVRDVVIDYISTPLKIDYKDIMYRKLGSQDIKWRLLLDVYHPLVLLAFAVTFVFTSLLLFLLLVTSPISVVSDMKKTVLIESFWYNFGSIFHQGGRQLSTSAPVRVLLAAWWFMTVVMASVFCANVIACLAVPKRDIPFSTFEELLQNKEYKWGLNGGGSTEFLIATSPDPMVKALYREMIRFNKTDNSILTNDVSVHFRRLQTEKYAFVYGHGRLGAGLDCWMEYLGVKLLVYSKAFAVPDQSPLKVELDEIMSRLLENGLLKTLNRKWLTGYEQCEDGVPRKVTVNLQDIQSAFYVLCIGLVGAALTMLLEHIMLRSRNLLVSSKQ